MTMNTHAQETQNTLDFYLFDWYKICRISALYEIKTIHEAKPAITVTLVFVLQGRRKE